MSPKWANGPKLGDMKSSRYTFEIQNSKFKIQNSKFKIQNSKFKIQNSKFKIQNSKFKIHLDLTHVKSEKVREFTKNTIEQKGKS
jgi:hypothetical protein